MSIDNDIAMLAAVDREDARIREMLAEFPAVAHEMGDPGPWADGAALVLTDCLVFRSDPDRMLASMWAWLRRVKP